VKERRWFWGRLQLCQITSMTNKIISLLVIFIAISTNGQELQNLYFDRNWKLCTAKNASYTRVILVKENLNFEGDFTDTNQHGVVVTEGVYSNHKKNGKFTFRYENGQEHIKGSYQNDEPMGTWVFYYPSGLVKHKIEFIDDEFVFLELNAENGTSLLNKPFLIWEYPYSNGTVLKGELNFGQKNGKWNLIENGKTIGYQVYKNGKFKKTFETLFKTFTKNRLLSNRIFTPLYITYSEQLNISTEISQLDYPFLKELPSYGSLGDSVGIQDGEIIMALDSPPLFLGGKERFNQIIRENIRPTREMNGHKGKVLIEIYINENGDAYKLRKLRSDNEILDAEVIRLAKLILEWKPAIFNGKAIESKVTLPFALNFKQN